MAMPQKRLNLTRITRSLAILASGLLLAACESDQPRSAIEEAAHTRIAAVGLARAAPGRSPVYVADGCARIAADGRSCVIAFAANSPVRIASISKLVTVIGAMRLVEDGILDIDADVAGYLNFPLRNPAFPDKPVTLRQLFAHTSGVRDGADFIVPLGGRLADTMNGAGHWNTAHPPGAYFTYSNLGIIIAATVMEAATGERFDRLMARLVLEPLSLEASYNWSGSSADTAACAATLYRTAGDDEVWHPDGPFLPQVDDRDGALPDCAAPVIAPGFPCNLDVYPPGTNAGIFSPHGGLRISLRELTTIGRLLAGKGEVNGVRLLKPETFLAFGAPAWLLQPDGGNGETGYGTMCGYGIGIHLLGAAPGSTCHDDAFGDGGTRFGHAAEAYGLLGGLWIDPATGVVTAYFVTGTSTDVLSDRGDRSGFTRLEEALAQQAVSLRPEE
jgi:CubicO group peptidase (beta-lactamase class C family)